MSKVLKLLFLSLFLSGCIASVNPSGGSFKEIKIEADKSRIIIIRRGGSLIGMDTPRLGIAGNTSSEYYETKRYSDFFKSLIPILEQRLKTL